MFGKRSGPGVAQGPAQPSPFTPAAPAVPVLSDPEPAGSDARSHTPRPPEPPPIVVAQEKHRSEEYYQTKSMIFGALIEAIDLAQLSLLEGEAAREEIRDIVTEIIALKNVVLSI